MRAGALLLVLLTLVGPAATARAGGSSLAYAPAAAGPGAEVIVTIQLATPPLAGTAYFMILENGIDNPNNFTVADPIPFDSTGHAEFSFTVPDVLPAMYRPSIGCVNTGADDVCTSPGVPSFEGVGAPFEVLRTSANQGRFKLATFRLTLDGPIPATHAFGIRYDCDPDCIFEGDQFACIPPDGRHAYDRCRDQTYEFQALISAGTTVDYELLRWTSAPAAIGPADAEVYLPGSFVVRGPITISLGFDSSGASTLPNTAVPAGQGA